MVHVLDGLRVHLLALALVFETYAQDVCHLGLAVAFGVSAFDHHVDYLLVDVSDYGFEVH